MADSNGRGAETVIMVVVGVAAIVLLVWFLMFRAGPGQPERIEVEIQTPTPPGNEEGAPNPGAS